MKKKLLEAFKWLAAGALLGNAGVVAYQDWIEPALQEPFVRVFIKAARNPPNIPYPR